MTYKNTSEKWLFRFAILGFFLFLGVGVDSLRKNFKMVDLFSEKNKVILRADADSLSLDDVYTSPSLVER